MNFPQLRVSQGKRSVATVGLLRVTTPPPCPLERPAQQHVASVTTTSKGCCTPTVSVLERAHATRSASCDRRFYGRLRRRHTRAQASGERACISQHRRASTRSFAPVTQGPRKLSAKGWKVQGERFNVSRGEQSKQRLPYNSHKP